MHPTPTILVAAYQYLQATPPFRKWRLPPADEIIFKVSNALTLHGQLTHYPPAIALSAKTTRTTEAILSTMAHEMIHLHLHLVGAPTSNLHNAEFHRLARLVCRHHGFPLADF